MKESAARAVFDYAPPAVLLALALVYLVTGYGYAPEARAFPVTVAWASLVLAALDLGSRTKTRAGETILRWFNPAARAKPETREQYPALKQLAAVGWIAGFVALMVLIGILYAVPVYVFASMVLRGRRPLVLCLLVSAGIGIFVWALFVQLLVLQLYPGWLFGGY